MRVRVRVGETTRLGGHGWKREGELFLVRGER